MTNTIDLSQGAFIAQQIRTARRRASALAILRDVLADPIGQACLALLETLDRGPGADGPAPRGVAAAYSALFMLLAEEAAPAIPGADAWQSHLLWRLLDNSNPFSAAAERLCAADLPASLLDAARRDLRGLQWLYSLGAGALRDATLALLGDDLADALPAWETLAAQATGADARTAMARRLATALDWGALAEELAGHWRRAGLGLFARYRAARWSVRDGGRLVGLPFLDPVRLGDLVAYEAERAPLLRNTERFLAGLPAHHALLYGERGTGKSSTVKALLHEYGARGLRLVEVAKDDLADLHCVLETLRAHPQRFIVFVDDLSFEEQEVQYKALKAALEGTVEGWPANALLYVTTNRRHLVRERFGDRVAEEDAEVRPRDTMEEKLSLADRFGLHITFPAPDQERYLAIATALAAARGIALSEGEVRQRALQWALWHNGRSCRSARQFVDDLTDEALG